MIVINAKKTEPIFCTGSTEEERFLCDWLQNDIQADSDGIQMWLNDLNKSDNGAPVLSGGNSFLIDCLQTEVVLYKERSGEKIIYPKHVIRKALMELNKACKSSDKHYKKSFNI